MSLTDILNAYKKKLLFFIKLETKELLKQN